MKNSSLLSALLLWLSSFGRRLGLESLFELGAASPLGPPPGPLRAEDETFKSSLNEPVARP